MAMQLLFIIIKQKFSDWCNVLFIFLINLKTISVVVVLLVLGARAFNNEEGFRGGSQRS